MSWIDKINEDLIIITGDGKEYRPDWLNAERQKDFNTSEFNFSDVQGSLVIRKEPKGARYGLELHFQGEDCIEVGNAFWKSADDKRHWIITHPFYGKLSVQLISLKQDNTRYNDSIFTGSVVETITQDYPQANLSVVDKAVADQQAVADHATASFDVELEAADLTTMTENNQSLYNESVGKINDQTQAEEYFNLFSEANTAVLNATAEPLAAMRAIQRFVSMPFLFATGASSRLDLLNNQFKALSTGVVNITTLSGKKIYESMAAGLLSALAAGVVTPQEGDFKTRNQVIAVQEKLLQLLNEHVTNLDALQSETGAEKHSFIPNTALYKSLHDVVILAVAKLNEIVADSKQEREVILEEDSNPILLAHRFYGMDSTDNSLQYFIDTNDLVLDQLFEIKKGTTIKYYV